MRLEQGGGAQVGPWIKHLLVAAVVVAGVAVPAWLYYSRGRKVPLEVLLEAPRYVVSSGETLTLKSQTLPTDRGVTRRWSGPGTNAAKGAAEVRWTAPGKPGLYTVTLTAQRAGTRAKDAITLRVIAAPLSGYPLDRPPAPLPAPTLPLCPTAPQPPPLGVTTRLHGRACAGARVVLEAVRQVNQRVAKRPPWPFVTSTWWQVDGGVQRGRFAELRLPAQGKTVATLAFRVFGTPCLRRVVRAIEVDTSCRAAPRAKGLVADFGGRLVSPGAFQLTAKPPRPPTAAVYSWQLEPGVIKKTNTPRLVHRFSKRRASYVVRLTVEAGPERASAVRLLRDRTYRHEEHPHKTLPSPSTARPAAF